MCNPDFTNVDMRNRAFRKMVAEKPLLLMGAHPCANWRSKSNASWIRMTQREKDDELHRVGTSCMNTVRASCRGGKIASKNSGDDRCQADV